MGDDPPYLTVGTEVSAKYKGAFCEAKIRKVVRIVKCRVTFKSGLGSSLLSDDHIKGSLRVGANVEAKHPDKSQYFEACITKIQDCSQYTVVFDDGDITTLRRSALCLKSGRHFNESETLDQLPLTHPEHFSNPVVGARRGARRRNLNDDDKDNESSDEEESPSRKGKKKSNREFDIGKVVCVEISEKKKNKDAWFPALVVCPSAQETVKIRTKDEYLVRSFRDGRYYTVPKKEASPFNKDSPTKMDSNSSATKSAVDKAMSYLEKNDLPPHWDRETLFGSIASNSDGQLSDSDMEDDTREEKDRFVAELFKFMEERDTPINKVPTIGNKDLDLYKLYKIVSAKGGYNKVTNATQWKPVTIKMGLGSLPSTATINNIKMSYKKYLYNFEDFYRKLGCTMKATTSKARTTSNRSLIRERHASSSTKETSKKEKTPDSISSASSKKEAEDIEKRSSSSAEPETDSQSTVSDSDAKKSEVEESPRRSRSRQDKNRKDREESTEKFVSTPTAPGKKKRVAASKEKETPKPKEKTKDVSTTKSREKPEREASKSTKEKESPKKDKDKGKDIAKSKDKDTPKPKEKESSKSKEKDKEPVKSKEPEITSKPSPVPVVKKGRASNKNKKSTKESEEPEDSKEISPSILDSPSHISKDTEVKLGDKLLVYYPSVERNVTYEAKVVDTNEKLQSYFVHYTGWNTRYDEWIRRDRIKENISLKPGEKGKPVPHGKGVDSMENVKENSKSAKNSAAPVLPAKRKGSRGPVVSKEEKESGNKLSGSQSSVSSTASSSTTATVTPVNSKGNNNKIATPASAPVVIPSRGSTGTRSKSGVVKRKRFSGEEVDFPKRRKVVKKTEKSGTPAIVPSDTDSDSSVKTNDTKASTTTTHSMRSGKTSRDKKIEEDDASSISSSTSNSQKDGPPSTEKEKLDLKQIRSEMKGVDKILKAPASAPSSGKTSSELDIYEFSEDAVLLETPKLKMFSPAKSPDKKDDKEFGDDTKVKETIKSSIEKLESLESKSKVAPTAPQTTSSAKVVVASATVKIPAGPSVVATTARSISPAITDLGTTSKKLSSTKGRLAAVLSTKPSEKLVTTDTMVVSEPTVVEPPINTTKLQSEPATSNSCVESSKLKEELLKPKESSKPVVIEATVEKTVVDKTPKTPRGKKRSPPEPSSVEKKRSARRTKANKNEEIELVKEPEVVVVKKSTSVSKELKPVATPKKKEEPEVPKITTEDPKPITDITPEPINIADMSLDPQTGNWVPLLPSESKSETIELDLEPPVIAKPAPKTRKMSPKPSRKPSMSPARKKSKLSVAPVEEITKEPDENKSNIVETVKQDEKLSKPQPTPMVVPEETKKEEELKPLFVKLDKLPEISSIPSEPSSAAEDEIIKLEDITTEEESKPRKPGSRRNSVVTTKDSTEDDLAGLKCDESLDDKEDSDVPMEEISPTSKKEISPPTESPENKEEFKSNNKVLNSAEEESCSSLLCEEIIPGSPSTEFDQFGPHNEDAMMPESKETLVSDNDKEFKGTLSGESKSTCETGSKSSSLESSSSKPLTFEGSIVKKDESTGKVPDLPPPSSIPSAFGMAQLPPVDNTPPMTPESSSISSGESPRGDSGRVSPPGERSSSKSKESSDVDSGEGRKGSEGEGSNGSDTGRSSKASNHGVKRDKISESRHRPTSPPMKRRRIVRRNKSPDDLGFYQPKGRTSSGRRINASRHHDDNMDHHSKSGPPPSPPVDLSNPPKSEKFNFIPSLDGVIDGDQRVACVLQALNELREKYNQIKTEMAAFERRRKRWKRKEKEKAAELKKAAEAASSSSANTTSASTSSSTAPVASGNKSPSSSS